MTGLEGAFSRGRLLSGMVLEDILEYSKVGSIFKKLEPKWAQEQMDTLQFGRVHHPTADHAINPHLKANKINAYIPQGGYKRVWHKPIFGLLNQNHWIPTQYAPLTFEMSLQDGSQWCSTEQRAGDGGTLLDASTTYELRIMYLYYDIATLDSELSSQFANMLKSGGDEFCI